MLAQRMRWGSSAHTIIALLITFADENSKRIHSPPAYAAPYKLQASNALAASCCW
jgi:hypothetical protein